VFHAIITGGEPLVNQAGLFTLLSSLKSINISATLNSNLALLTPKLAQKIKGLGVRTVLVSFLSHDRLTHDFLAGSVNSYDYVIRGIKIARACGLYVAVNMVVSKYNLSHVEQTGRLVHALGAFAFSATRVMPPRQSYKGESSDFVLGSRQVRILLKSLLRLKETGMELDSLVPYPTCFLETNEEYALLGQRTCSAGKTSLAIGADGSVRACPHHEVVYGSLVDENLEAIWLRMKEWRDGSLLPIACKSCHLFSKCGGGCRMAGQNNSICAKDFIMQEERVQSFSFFSSSVNKLIIGAETRMRIRDACRFRKDAVIGLINTGGIKNVLVENDTLDILWQLHKSGEVFTPGSLRKKYVITTQDDMYFSFFVDLIKRGVVELLN
jgi:radical SAM protein with 4Fe4S-binding SPASM domain